MPTTSRIRHALWLSLIGLTALWLLAEPQPGHLTYFSFRNIAMQYSGALAIGAMSLAMMLATRPRWIESHLDGLDKMYRLHKWLGITALVTSVVHWWLGQGTKWMVGWGWLVRPQRGARPAGSEEGLIEAWFHAQRHLAEDIGEWAFYAAALFMVVALVSRIPYRWFAKTHTVLAAVYLALVFHSVVLVRFAYWGQPIGWVLAALMVGGSVSAVLVLLGRVGAGRKVQGTVVATNYYPGVNTFEVQARLRDGWTGHAHGQFAFVTFDAQEGPHPYTMASHWDPATRLITFIVKGLGDYTWTLPDRIQIGAPVTVEGPYGRFNFEDDRPRQIWVGAGIGITPFVARMKHLAAHPDQARGLYIDLFHPTAMADREALAKLKADAQAAGVRLHLMIDAEDGLLDGDRIREAVTGWRDASLWFCGPTAFGRSLLEDMILHGLPRRACHQELFQMR